jgi:hypothetical protein
MITAKELLLKVKALFDAPAAPTVPVDTTAPADITVAGTATPFKLQDGTDIMITIGDPAVSSAPDAGDTVTIAGVPAPAADYVLADGTTFTTDATGAITVIAPPAAVTQTPEQMEAEAARVAALAVPAAPVVLTAEAVQAMYAKFATGTPEDRIGNLEIMVKALMDCNFGYEIRKGQDAAAIAVYRESLAPTAAAVTAQATQMEAATQKIEKQDLIIAGLFELAEKLVEMPSAEPKTLTGNKKDQFDKMKAKEAKLESIAAAIKEMKTKK